MLVQEQQAHAGSSCCQLFLLCRLSQAARSLARSHPCNLSPFSPTDVPVEKLATMPALRVINLRLNPLSAEVRVIAPPLIKFDMLTSPEDAQVPPP